MAYDIILYLHNKDLECEDDGAWSFGYDQSCNNTRPVIVRTPYKTTVAITRRQLTTTPQTSPSMLLALFFHFSNLPVTQRPP
jgi:hypothetical protein